jgi:hypothetical protein
MDSQPNLNLGNWLAQLNEKTVDKVFQVDFNKDRQEDIYLPWLFFITFSDFDSFLEIEGDFDGDHIRLSLYDNSALENKLKENNLPDESDCWRVYDTQKNETLGQLLGQKIKHIEYGMDKDESELNGTNINEQTDIFNFIRFNCDKVKLTIFDGSATGLGVSTNKDLKLHFEHAIKMYHTKQDDNR